MLFRSRLVDPRGRLRLEGIPSDGGAPPVGLAGLKRQLAWPVPPRALSGQTGLGPTAAGHGLSRSASTRKNHGLAAWGFKAAPGPQRGGGDSNEAGGCRISPQTPLAQRPASTGGAPGLPLNPGLPKSVIRSSPAEWPLLPAPTSLGCRRPTHGAPDGSSGSRRAAADSSRWSAARRTPARRSD